MLDPRGVPPSPQRGTTAHITLHAQRGRKDEREGSTLPASPNDATLYIKFHLPFRGGAMAAGIAPRYKTGPWLDTLTLAKGQQTRTKEGPSQNHSQ